MDVTRVVPLTLLAQVLISLAVAAGSWMWFGAVAAVSAVLGGAAAFVPNAFLAARVLQPNSDLSARGMMRQAWFGEIGKLLLTAVLFGVIFGFVRPLEPLAVFAGFIAAQLVVFGALLVGGGIGTQQPMTKS